MQSKTSRDSLDDLKINKLYEKMVLFSKEAYQK